MPHADADRARSNPASSRKAASTLESSEPSTPVPDHVPSKPREKGAFFRAFVEAGVGPMVAYTAEEQVQSMVSQGVAAQVQPILVEMRQLFVERDRKLDTLTEIVVRQGHKLDEHDRKLDALVADVQGVKDVVGVRFDALKRELRLIWGALGVLLTVLTVVFSLLFGG